MGLILPVRLPLASEDMRQPTTLENDLFSPHSEVQAETNTEVNAEVSTEVDAAGVEPRVRMPPRAQDNRTPIPPEDNTLLNLVQGWNADAHGSDAEKPGNV
jgi:hypothetical protein